MLLQAILKLPIAPAICVLVLCVLPCDGQPKQATIISPDPKVQELLGRWMNAPDEYDKEASEALKRLKELARVTPAALAPQLIFRTAHPKNQKEAIGILGIAMRLKTDTELRLPMVPFLESEDKDVREAAFIWLGGFDGFGVDKEANLGSYIQILMRQKDSPPPGLVKYLYDISPSRALLVLGRVYADGPLKPGAWPRPLMWSDHVISTVKWRIRNRFIEDGDLEKAQKEMDRLSKHEGWYARRYVVHVIDDIPKLGTPEIIGRLKKDSNPLVSESAKLIK